MEDGAIRALAAVAKTSDELAQRATAALSSQTWNVYKAIVECWRSGNYDQIVWSKDPEVRRLSAHTICHLVSCAEGQESNS